VSLKINYIGSAGMKLQEISFLDAQTHSLNASDLFECVCVLCVYACCVSVCILCVLCMC